MFIVLGIQENDPSSVGAEWLANFLIPAPTELESIIEDWSYKHLAPTGRCDY